MSAEWAEHRLECGHTVIGRADALRLYCRECMEAGGAAGIGGHSRAVAPGAGDPRVWLEGVRRRLGLVAEVHRGWVWQSVGLWHWWCLRDSCGRAHHNLPSQPDAFAAALAHARSFMPEPPEEAPATRPAAYRAAIAAIMAPREVRWLTCEDWTTGPEPGFNGSKEGAGRD